MDWPFQTIATATREYVLREHCQQSTITVASDMLPSAPLILLPFPALFHTHTHSRMLSSHDLPLLPQAMKIVPKSHIRPANETKQGIHIYIISRKKKYSPKK